MTTQAILATPNNNPDNVRCVGINSGETSTIMGIFFEEFHPLNPVMEAACKLVSRVSYRELLDGTVVNGRFNKGAWDLGMGKWCIFHPFSAVMSIHFEEFPLAVIAYKEDGFETLIALYLSSDSNYYHASVCNKETLFRMIRRCKDIKEIPGEDYCEMQFQGLGIIYSNAPNEAVSGVQVHVNERDAHLSIYMDGDVLPDTLPECYFDYYSGDDEKLNAHIAEDRRLHASSFGLNNWIDAQKAKAA